MPRRAHITLNGQEYTLSYQARNNAYSASPQPRQDEQQQERFWMEWVQRSFHEGERLKRIISAEDLQKSRYAEGLHVNVEDIGKVRLQPTEGLSYQVSSANMPMVTSTDGASVILGLAAAPTVRIWNNGTWSNASSVSGSGAVTDIINGGEKLYMVRGSGVHESADDGDNWTQLQYDRGGTPTNYSAAVGLAYLNGELIVMESTRIYNHTLDEAVHPTFHGTFCTAFRENLYWIEDHRLFRYMGTASYLYCELPTGFLPTALMAYRFAMYVLGYYEVQGGRKAAVHYVMNGAENHLYSLGDYSGDARIHALCGWDNEIFFANPLIGGVDRFDLTYGGLSCGPSSGAASIPYKGLAVADGYLFRAQYDNTPATDGVYISDIESPASFEQSGYIITPDFDFGSPHQQKLAHEIHLMHAPLDVGQSIVVEVSYDMGLSYTEVGRSEAIDSRTTTIYIDNDRFTYVRLRITLNGPGTSTPEFHGFAFTAGPVSDIKWMWTMRLEVFKPQGGAEAIEELSKQELLQGIVDFIDIHGGLHRVFVSKLSMLHMPDNEESGTILVELREV